MQVNSSNLKLEHVTSDKGNLAGHRKRTRRPSSEKRFSSTAANFDLAFSISRFSASCDPSSKKDTFDENSSQIKREAFSKSADSGKIRNLHGFLPQLRPSLSFPKMHADADSFTNISHSPVLSGLHNITTTCASNVCASNWEFSTLTSSKSELANQTHAAKTNYESMKSTDICSGLNTQRFSKSLDGLSLKHMARNFSNTSGVTLTSYSPLPKIENRIEMTSVSSKNVKKKVHPVKSIKKLQWSPSLSRFFKSSERNKPKQQQACEVAGVNLDSSGEGVEAPVSCNSEDFDDSFPFTYDYASIDEEEETSDEDGEIKDDKLNLSWPISRLVGLHKLKTLNSNSNQTRKQEETNRQRQYSNRNDLTKDSVSKRTTRHLEEDTTIDEIAAFSVKFELMPKKGELPSSNAMDVPKKEYSLQQSWSLSKSLDAGSRHGSVTSEESINALINKYRNRNTPEYSSSTQSGNPRTIVSSGVRQDDGWTIFSDKQGHAGTTQMPTHHVSQANSGKLRTAVVQPVQKNSQQLTMHSTPGQAIPQLSTPHNLKHVGMPVHSTYLSPLPTNHSLTVHSSPATNLAPISIANPASQLVNTTPHQLHGHKSLHVSMSLPTQPHALLSTPKSVGPISASSTPSQVHQHPDPNQIHKTRNVQDRGIRKVPRSNSEEDSQATADNAIVPDPWLVTEEQRKYYTNQFSQMQPNMGGKIDGHTARNFFTKSRLPIPELSHIWELCDMDQDGNLTLTEFCAAFHLVVARKNGYDLPIVLPQSLIPPLVDISNTDQQGNGDQSQHLGPPPAALQQISMTMPIKEEQVTSPLSKPNLPVPDISSPERPYEHKGLESRRDPQNSVHQLNPHAAQDRWETFSDRTSSSTTLANFDQAIENTENLAHPIAMRMTPSKHEAYTARMRNSPLKSTDDDDSSPPQASRVPITHRSLTNPYGSLTNDLSEPDSSFETLKVPLDRRRVPSSSSTSSSATGPLAAHAENPTWPRQNQHEHKPDLDQVQDTNDVPDSVPTFSSLEVKGHKREHTKKSRTRKGMRHRSSSASSRSSVGTSDRSSSELDGSYHSQTNIPSDQEHSDWSSRPLRPRSGSDSSVESSNIHKSIVIPSASNNAPTPPPRPSQPNQVATRDNHVVLPGPINAKVKGANEISTSAPTPPPRPPQSQSSTVPIQQETFADFSQFDRQKASEEEAVPVLPPAEHDSAASVSENSDKNTVSVRVSGEKDDSKPLPAPRHTKAKTHTKTHPTTESKEEISPDKSTQKKAPTKPPRSRLVSTDVVKEQPTYKQHLKVVPAEESIAVPAQPKQDSVRQKAALQQSIRELKLKNNRLTRLNAELQQELKDVMQSRIVVEMSIHQLRPFS